MKFGRDKAPVDPEVAAAKQQARQRRKIIFGLVAVVLVVVGYFIGAAFLPRWWARQVGDWVNDSFTRGWIYGIAFGLVFTLVPLVVLATVFFRKLNNKARAVIVVLAVILAVPNLLTLGISTGSGSGAHAGSRILDDRAPFFQGASLLGAIIAAIIFALSIWQYRANRRVRAAKKSAKARRQTEPTPAAVETEK
jgi:heme/copper-type cytochrome/quinol oxidase subunit 4